MATHHSPVDPLDTLDRLRGYLRLVLLTGVVGVSIELLLIGHFEAIGQLIPMVLLGLGLVALAWHAVSRRRAAVRVLRWIMALYVLAGLVGIGLHLRGNVEFELEMYPDLRGTELLAKTLTGATPALAPGTMVLIGLLGTLYTYRHPDAA